jgi:hypothetical protein
VKTKTVVLNPTAAAAAKAAAKAAEVALVLAVTRAPARTQTRRRLWRRSGETTILLVRVCWIPLVTQRRPLRQQPLRRPRRRTPRSCCGAACCAPRRRRRWQSASSPRPAWFSRVVEIRAAGTRFLLRRETDGAEEVVSWQALRAALQRTAAAALEAARGGGAPPPPPPPLLFPAAAAAAGAGAGAGAAPEQARFKGVSRTPNGRWCARTCVDAHTRRHGGVHDTQEAAARAYDDAVRRHGILLVNFPRPGTAETQAAPGKRYSKKDQVDASPQKKKARVAAPAAAHVQAGAPAAPAAAPLAAPPPLPSLAQAAQAPQVAAAAAANNNAEEEDIASFLSAIVPPLSCLAATLAALPRSGMRMAHLTMAMSSAPEDRKALLEEAAEMLDIVTPADRMALKHALMRRAARAAAAHGAGAGAAA